MSDVEIDYLERTTGPGITELPAGVRVQQEGTAEEPFEPSLYPGWDEEHFEIFLRGVGSGIHQLIGASEKDWLMTRTDLDRIVPPMTRIANRWEPALRLSPWADPALLIHGFALYVWRSELERRRAVKDREPVEPAADYVYESDIADPGETESADDDEFGAPPRPHFPDSPKARSSTG